VARVLSRDAPDPGGSASQWVPVSRARRIAKPFELGNMVGLASLRGRPLTAL
jgi:hypothetical protein